MGTLKKNSSKAMNISGWLEQLVMNDRPFSFVENKYDTKYSTLEPISKKTLVSYFDAQGPKVEEALKFKLSCVKPKRFGLIFDCKYFNC
jgi:hypothetical protein